MVGSSLTGIVYDAQYTSTGTGLIYMRARTYDSVTAQFLSVDPFEEWTGELYSYVGDNPLNHDDPRGLFSWGPIAEGLGVGATCLLGPEVCVPVGLADLDAHVVAADINSAETGCSPWSQIGPALVGAGVGALPFAGGFVAKEVWSASQGAFRVGASAGLAAGSLASVAASSAHAATSHSASANCGCSG